jgi:membrane protease YdiL (CAAX protease family)
MLRRIVLTAQGRLRIAWRIVLFLLSGAGITLLLLLGLSWAGWQTSAIGQSVAFCLALLVAGWILTRSVNRRPLTAIGLHPAPPALFHLLLGTLAGGGMMGGIFLVEFATGNCAVVFRALPTGEILSMVLESATVFGAAAAAEELLFRGYPFQSLIQGIRFVPATLLVSVSFAFAHVGNPNVTPLALANIALAGVWLSCAYLRTRALWLPIGLHFSWNFAQTTLFGFPTSGVAVDGRSILELVQAGPDWLTGGMFGPEGGILGTIALGLGTWHVLVFRGYRPQEGVITLDTPDPVPDPPVGEGART